MAFKSLSPGVSFKSEVVACSPTRLSQFRERGLDGRAQEVPSGSCSQPLQTVTHRQHRRLVQAQEFPPYGGQHWKPQAGHQRYGAQKLQVICWLAESRTISQGVLARFVQNTVRTARSCCKLSLVSCRASPRWWDRTAVANQMSLTPCSLYLAKGQSRQVCSACSVRGVLTCCFSSQTSLH